MHYVATFDALVTHIIVIHRQMCTCLPSYIRCLIDWIYNDLRKFRVVWRKNTFLFHLQFSHCHVCEGFYGSNFGQPVCSTCHLFLFPDDIDSNEDGQGFSEKQDSGDSGNEEPHGEADFYVPQVDCANGERPVQPSSSCTAVNKAAEKIAERVNILSSPRDYLKENAPEGLFDSLPPEVLLVVFRQLNDISLWNARNVCTRWRQILDGESNEKTWELFVKNRWPLYKPMFKVECWKTIYTKL